MIPLLAPIGTKLAFGIGEGVGALLGNATQPGKGTDTSFVSLLGDAAGRVADNLQHAEQLSVKALQGDGDMRSVVDAVMSAQQSLQAAVAIRDKIVTAYLEISRMAI
jgi:flagellar hook-basal body complex protein FliE